MRNAKLQHLKQDALKIKEEIEEENNKKRHSLSRVSEHSAKGEYSKAYKVAKLYNEEKFLIDSAGVMGKVDAQVPTQEFVDWAKAKLCDQIKGQIANWIEQSRSVRLMDYRLAGKYLHDAQKLIQDVDERELFLDELSLLSREERDLRDFSAASEKIRLALTFENAYERILKLAEASREYPDYPNLSEYMKQASIVYQAECFHNITDRLVNIELQLGKLAEESEEKKTRKTSQAPQPGENSQFAD